MILAPSSCGSDWSKKTLAHPMKRSHGCSLPLALITRTYFGKSGSGFSTRVSVHSDQISSPSRNVISTSRWSTCCTGLPSGRSMTSRMLAGRLAQPDQSTCLGSRLHGTPHGASGWLPGFGLPRGRATLLSDQLAEANGHRGWNN
jgi:hypothetical protein